MERLMWQDSKFTAQRKWRFKSTTISVMLNRWDRHLQCPRNQSWRCWMRLETVWAIVQVQTMRSIRMTRKMMKKIESLANSVKMTNQAGWWALFPTRYSTAWEGLHRRGWGLMNWPNLVGGRCRLHVWEIYEVWDSRIDGSSSCQASNRQDCSHTITDNIWRAYAESRYDPRTITNEAWDVSTRK